jgi:hypothetical protein
MFKFEWGVPVRMAILAILLVFMMVGCVRHPLPADNPNPDIENATPEPVARADASERSIVSGKVIPYGDAVIAIVYEGTFYKVILKRGSKTETLLSDSRPIFNLTRVGDTLNAIIAYDIIEGSEYLNKNYVSIDLITKEIAIPTLTLPEGMVAHNFFWLKGNAFVWCVSTDGHTAERSEIFELTRGGNGTTEPIASSVNYVYADESRLYFAKDAAPGNILAYDAQTDEIREYYDATSADRPIYAWIARGDYLYIESDDRITRVNPNAMRRETLVTKDFDRFDAYRSYLTDSVNESHFYYFDNVSINELELESGTSRRLLSGKFDDLSLIGNRLYYYEVTDENIMTTELGSVLVE